MACTTLGGGEGGRETKEILLNDMFSQASVAHTYNQSYLGDWEQ